MKGITLKHIVEGLFTTVPDRSNDEELTFICPVPGCGDNTGNRSVNLGTGKTNCWRCGKGGDFVKWARGLGYEVEGGDPIGLDSEDSLENFMAETPKAPITPVATGVTLPQGFTLLVDNEGGFYWRKASEMAQRKNLDIEDFVRAGAGFTHEGLWEPYIIFPVYESERLVYYQGRTYSRFTEGGKTKRFPSRKVVPLGSRYWVYNLEALKDPAVEVVVMVESILNVLSLEKQLAAWSIDHIVPVCVFKHSVSPPQIAKIERYKHVQELCVLFDHDAIGASWKEAFKLSNRSKLSVAEMPSGETGKLDANDDVIAALQAIHDRKPFHQSTEVTHRLNFAANLAPYSRGLFQEECLQNRSRSAKA